MHKRLIPRPENLNKSTIENVVHLHQTETSSCALSSSMKKKINAFKMNHNILYIIKHAAHEKYDLFFNYINKNMKSNIAVKGPTRTYSLGD